MSKEVYTEKEVIESCEGAYNDGYIVGYRVGWLEGVLDSEGSISLIRYKRKGREWYNYTPIVSIGNTSKVFLEIYNECIKQIGHVNIQKYGNENQKTMWHLNIISRYKLKKFLCQLTLIIKEKQRLLLLEAIDILDSKPYAGEYGYVGKCGERLTQIQSNRLNEIWLEMKELNKHGEGHGESNTDRIRR